MSQRLVIRLIPIQIFVVCSLVGWLAIGSVRALIANGNLPSVPSAAQTAVAGVAGANQASGPADSSATTLSPVFTPEVQHWAGKIASWSALFKLDPNLVATIM